MKLNILNQILDAYSDFVRGEEDPTRYDFTTTGYNEVQDPVGGYEGVTIYDQEQLDQDVNLS